MPTRDALLRTLERILAVEATDLRTSMREVADLVASAVGAEKVDVFMLDPDERALVAAGTSDTPLGRKQRALGLDRLALAEGGRAVEVFRTGERFLCADAGADPKERRDLVRDLGVRSAAMVPLEVDGARRGALAVTSTAVGAFGEDDLDFVSAVARWVAAVVHRAELVERLAAGAKEDGRRAAADEIVMIVSHDFRNFLAPIAGRLALLRRRAELEGRARDRRDCEAAERSVRGVTRLIEDLLDSSRIDQGLLELARAPLDLAALAREVAAGLALPDREILVDGPAELTVVADGARLAQVLENLLSNALKYAPPRTAVRVTIELAGSGAERAAVVRVSDEGEGIAPAVLPTIFERFGRERGSKGLGLGLFLAHGLAKAHGGSLRAESTPGKGSTFTLTLPLAPRDHAAAGAPPPAT